MGANLMESPGLFRAIIFGLIDLFFCVFGQDLIRIGPKGEWRRVAAGVAGVSGLEPCKTLKETISTDWIGIDWQRFQPYPSGMFKPVWIVFCHLAVFSLVPLQAASLFVANPGFEDISGESPYNEFTFGALNGWNLYDPGNVTSGGDGPTYYIGTLTPQPDPNAPGDFINFPAGAAEGQRVGIAFNFFGSGGGGEYGFTQTLASTLEANTLYTLQVEIGNIASGFSVDNTFFDLDGFPGYRVDFLAGGVVLSQDDNELFGLIPEGEWGTSTVTFQTGASHPQLGQALTIRLVNLNEVDPLDPGANLEVDFDDVRLDATTIPEPSTWVLMGMGLGLVGLLRKRRS
jgi:hapalindole H/12-epi-hapalindole U/12-epi-fischerindole U synthase